MSDPQQAPPSADAAAPNRHPKGTFARRIGQFLGLLFVAALLWGLVQGVSAAVAVVRKLDTDLSKALLTGAIALIGSVASLAIGKAYEVRASIKKELREKKAPIYDEIVSTLFRVFFNEKVGRPALSELEVMQFFAKTTEKLTIWGADDVIQAFGRFRTGAAAGTPESLFIFEDLLFAIRRDLGHRNKNLGHGALLRLFVNDMDEILKKLK